MAEKNGKNRQTPCRPSRRILITVAVLLTAETGIRVTASKLPKSPLGPFVFGTNGGRGKRATTVSSSIIRKSHDPTLNDPMTTVRKLRGGDIAGPLSSLPVFDILETLDLFGTVVFAFSGTICAGGNNMDLFGCIVVSIVSAMGGGTLRDVILGNAPVFWMRDVMYLHMCIVTSILTFFLWPLIERFGGRDNAWYLCFSDALGMGAFAVLGANSALRHKLGSPLTPLMCIVIGVMSATFGGVVRDVLCHQPARIFYANRSVYAPTALVGAAIFVYGQKWFPDRKEEAAVIGFVVAVSLRVMAYTYNIRTVNWLGRKSRLENLPDKPLV